VDWPKKSKTGAVVGWDPPAALAWVREAICSWGALWRGETRSTAKKVPAKALLCG